MRLIFFLSTLCILSAFKYDNPLVNNDFDLLNEFHRECLLTSRAHIDVLNKAVDGIFTNDPRFKKHLVCLAKKMGFMDAAGKIQKDAILEAFQQHTKYANEILESCLSDMGNAEETAYHFISCAFSKQETDL